MRPGMMSVGVAVLLCIALWAFWPRSEPRPAAQAGATSSATTALAPAPANPSGSTESARAISSARGAASLGSAKRQPSAEQQQLRERVVQSLRQRSERGGTPVEAPARAAPGGEPDHVPGEGTMKDKTGLMGDEVKVINRELMPMVSQCVDEAHERNPRLHGMLALSVKLASAEGIGSIFESVEPPATNEVDDPDMIDCIRQSAFTISLPKPKANSLHEGELTIPIDALPDAGAR